MTKNILIKGQSIFEVVFAVGIAALILIAVVSLSTQAVKNSDFSKNNALATKYAQQGIEYIRQQRDTLGWTAFVAFRPGSNDMARDFGILDMNSGTNAVDSLFTRTYTLNRISDEVYEVIVAVNWTDGAGEHEVESRTKLSNWRE